MLIKIDNTQGDHACSFCLMHAYPLITSGTGDKYICPKCAVYIHGEMVELQDAMDTAQDAMEDFLWEETTI